MPSSLIRDLEALKSRRVDFDVYKDCFDYRTTRISPSDVDWIVERNACFLIAEFKPSIDEALRSIGQQRLLGSWAMIGNYLYHTAGVSAVDAFVIVDSTVSEEGLTGREPEAWRQIINHTRPWLVEEFLPTTLEEVQKAFASWFKWADRQRPQWLGYDARPSTLAVLQSAYLKASPQEIDQFLEWLKQANPKRTA